MPKEIKVEIDEDGNTSFDVMGGKGKDCAELTKDLEKAIGKVKERKWKAEAKIGRNEGISVKRK